MENNKYHILIVEDDKEIRDGVEIYLKNQGYQVWKASNGKEGLEIVAQEEIHLAILDIMMPVMDGVTMLMKLREQNHEFPVIMLSLSFLPKIQNLIRLSDLKLVRMTM